MLDRAGFEDVRIVLSSGLDELTIFQILTQIADEAPRYGVDADHVIGRLLYGVGTKMATSDGRSLPRRRVQAGRHRRPGRMAPGDQGVGYPGQDREPGPQTGPSPLRPTGLATVDLMGLADEALQFPLEVRHHRETGIGRTLDESRVSATEELLEPAMLTAPTDDPAVVAEARKRRVSDLERLDPGVKRLVNPHVYHVSVTRRLADLKTRLIEETI